MNEIYLFIGDDLNLILNKTNEISRETSVQKFEITTEDELENLINTGCEIPLFVNKSTLQIYLNIKKLKLESDSLNKFIEFLKTSSNYKKVIIVSHLEKLDKATLKALLEHPTYKALEKVSRVEQYMQVKLWEKEDTKKIEELFLALVNKKFHGIFDLTSQILCLKNPLYVLAVLQGKFRQALEIKVNLESGKNNAQIAKLINIHPYKLELEIKKITGVDSNELKKIVLLLSDVEFKLKRGLVSEKNALDLLVIKV